MFFSRHQFPRYRKDFHRDLNPGEFLECLTFVPVIFSPWRPFKVNFVPNKWDLRFSLRWRCRCCSSGLWRRVDSIFSSEDIDSMFLRNAGIYLRVHTAPQQNNIDNFVYNNIVNMWKRKPFPWCNNSITILTLQSRVVNLSSIRFNNR
jgi:hypothetical protein